MSDDLKALRALVEQEKAPMRAGGFECLACGVRNDHDADCLVPAADAALARLEASFAFEPAGPMLAALRKQERIGYDKAREQAARVAEAAKDEEPWYDSHSDECGEASEIASRIRAMEPEP